MVREGRSSSCLGFLTPGESVSSCHQLAVTWPTFPLSALLMWPWGFSVFRNPLFKTPVVVAHSLRLKPSFGRACWQLAEGKMDVWVGVPKVCSVEP